MPFEFRSFDIPDVKLIIPRVFPDDRGHFLETYKESEFASQGILGPFRQDNQSSSRKGVLRGLHFQKPPHAQAKLVQVLSGVIYDVVVDLRPNSPSYAKWLGMTLNASEPCMLFVPEGFAHGFLVLSDKADVLYKTSSEYRPEAEGGIIWNDPALAIPWPCINPIVSAKDAALCRLRDISPV
jgi:dTDP-4-dehydrorhamnose 3,5-epimerase